MSTKSLANIFVSVVGNQKLSIRFKWTHLLNLVLLQITSIWFLSHHVFFFLLLSSVCYSSFFFQYFAHMCLESGYWYCTLMFFSVFGYCYCHYNNKKNILPPLYGSKSRTNCRTNRVNEVDINFITKDKKNFQIQTVF